MLARRLQRRFDQGGAAVLPNWEVPMGFTVDATLDRLAEHLPKCRLIRRDHRVESMFDEKQPLNWVHWRSGVEHIVGTGNGPVDGGLDKQRVSAGEVAVRRRSRDHRLL